MLEHSVDKLNALCRSDSAAMTAGLCQLQGDFESAKAVAPGRTQRDAHLVSELMSSLTWVLESHIPPAYAKYAASEALKEVLVWLARCSSGEMFAMEEGRACCKRLVLLLLDEAGASSVWCGRVLEELLRTLKGWQQASVENGARVELLSMLLRDSLTSLPRALARYISENQLTWLQCNTSAATEHALGVAGKRDAAALALSLLHRGIRCKLICCDEDGADTLRVISHITSLCLGFPAHASDEDDETGPSRCGEREQLSDGWGFGFGWGCLRRKCVAVLMASDLRGLQERDWARLTRALSLTLLRSAELLSLTPATKHRPPLWSNDVLEARSVRQAQGMSIVLLVRCLSLMLPACHQESRQAEHPPQQIPAAASDGLGPCSVINTCPGALVQGLAALRRLIQSKATTGKQDHREGLTGKAAAQGMCALLADSDALLFLCLIEALHLHKVLSRWTAVWRPTVTAVTAATAPRPCAQRRRDDEGCGAGGCDARSAAGLCLDANLRRAFGKRQRRSAIGLGAVAAVTAGKRQRRSASDAAEDADAGPDAPRNAATPSVSDLRGERAWFCEELSPARLLDAVCQLFAGDSGMLLDLMLSPDNQALAYMVAVLAQLDSREVPDGVSAVACAVGHVLRPTTRAWLQEVKRKIDSMQSKGLLPFDASPLSRRLARVLQRAEAQWSGSLASEAGRSAGCDARPCHAVACPSVV